VRTEWLLQHWLGLDWIGSHDICWIQPQIHRATQIIRKLLVDSAESEEDIARISLESGLVRLESRLQTLKRVAASCLTHSDDVCLYATHPEMHSIGGGGVRVNLVREASGWFSMLGYGSCIGVFSQKQR
jgi:hypothetical protein